MPAHPDDESRRLPDPPAFASSPGPRLHKLWGLLFAAIAVASLYIVCLALEGLKLRAARARAAGKSAVHGRAADRECRQTKKPIAGPVFRLKVTLEGIHPPIWRRLVVPADMLLADFHYVLQDAFGWTNSHLHQFVAGGKWIFSQVMEGIRYGDLQFDEIGGMKDEGRTTLAHLLVAVEDEIAYEYDFGDSWTHRVVLEEILPAAPAEVTLPACLDGGRACPPDDCGGAGGYERLLQALADPSHEDHKDMKEWVENVLGRKIDPEAFNLNQVNLAIKQEKTRKLTARAMLEDDDF